MNELSPEASQVSYNYGAIKTPFDMANQLYDAPIGEVVLKTYRWRVISFGLLGVAALLAVIVLLVSLNPEGHVYWAGVTPKNGKIAAFGELKQVETFSESGSLSQVKAHLDSQLQKEKEQPYGKKDH